MPLGCAEDDTPQLKEGRTEFKIEKEVTDPVKVNSHELHRAISVFLSENGKPLSRANEMSVARIGSGEENSIYVVNFLPEKGFVLLSSSKNCNPILAYSDKGSFTPDDLIGEVANWKEETLRAIDYLNQHPQDSTAIKARSQWRRFEKSLNAVKKLSRDIGIDPDHRDMPSDEEMKILISLYADSVNHWATQPDTRVYTLQEFEAAHPYEAEEIDTWARQNTYCEYQGAYKDLTFAVERVNGYYSGPGQLFECEWNQIGGFLLHMEPNLTVSFQLLIT